MRFSYTEKQHLLKAWVAISAAFAILFAGILSPDFILYFIISLFTVGLGFLLHELAHKYLAQRYGRIAEFRADDKMLVLAVLSAFVGFIFAAPGAVLIHGHITKEQNGKISAVGPLANIVLAIFFLGASFFTSGMVSSIMGYGFQINSFIALFNMIPFLNFDGRKIFDWNKLVYFSMTIISAILVFLPSIAAL